MGCEFVYGFVFACVRVSGRVCVRVRTVISLFFVTEQNCASLSKLLVTVPPAHVALVTFLALTPPPPIPHL